MEDKIRSINGFALMEMTSYSKINLDFVLQTNSYANDGVGSLLGTDSSTVTCMPCVVDDKPSHLQGEAGRSAVTSLALRFDERFYLQLLRTSLDQLLYGNGDSNKQSNQPDVDKVAGQMKIYRMKGLIQIEGSEKMFILQAVHNLFELDESEYTISQLEESKRATLLIVIGSSLDQRVIEQAFKSAVARK